MEARDDLAQRFCLLLPRHGRGPDAAQGTMLKRQPTLAKVAEAAFLASDSAGAMAGKVANLTCGALVN